MLQQNTRDSVPKGMPLKRFLANLEIQTLLVCIAASAFAAALVCEAVHFGLASVSAQSLTALAGSNHSASSSPDDSNLAVITVDYPEDSSIFPPEITSPTFQWRDASDSAASWTIDVTFNDGSAAIHAQSGGERLRIELTGSGATGAAEERGSRVADALDVSVVDLRHVWDHGLARALGVEAGPADAGAPAASSNEGK